MNAHQRRIALRWRQRTLSRALARVSEPPPLDAEARIALGLLLDDPAAPPNRPVEPRRE